jgi:hypothetical protein
MNGKSVELDKSFGGILKQLRQNWREISYEEALKRTFCDGKDWMEIG